LAKSQPFDYVEPARGVTEDASAERGKQLFETRGCLACHRQADFPKAKMHQGPNLTNLGGKLARAANPNGRKWLYSWLRNPSSYHPRTLMPNLILEPIDDGQGHVSDPAADIGAYLLASSDWQPQGVPDRELTAQEKEALYKLALDHLKDAYPRKQAEEYLNSGIPDSMRGELKGDDIELLGTASGEEQIRKQLLYVGRRSISKYGCSGCHDVPGYEDAKPIGTGLADWGRKAADKLAFEQITQFILHGHGHEKPPVQSNMDEDDSAYTGPDSQEAIAGEVELAHNEGRHELNFENLPPAVGFFMKKLFGHEREGFIWQKLRQPRSYDYKKTENKGYNERLRMPQFNLNDGQREQVITFVLGLVSEPPAQQYVYKAPPRRAAITEGLKVIEKYNCKGCHQFQMERWDLAYEAGDFNDPPQFDDYAFLEAHVTPQLVKSSLETDSRGLRHASLVGLPSISEKTGLPEVVDEDGSPIDPDDKTSPAFEKFMPWDNAVINGKVRPAGLQSLLVPMKRVAKQYPTAAELKENPAGYGGYLPRLIYTSVLAQERQSNPNAKADEAWGWLPPPLVGEGVKVQPDWLYQFLLDPYPIRPAVVLRMPKFNMSSAEASALVNYFAAVDNANYPYDFDPRTREGYLSDKAREEKNPHRLGDALKVITDNNYCVKCHLVGDFEPAGSQRAKGPHLDQVYKRLRPDYVLRWIARPPRILPYTSMPVNIPPDKPVSDQLYPGTSLEQVNGVVDLLLNWDGFMENRTSIKPLIKPAPAAPADGPQATGADARSARQEVTR
jgi:cytochrome c2